MAEAAAIFFTEWLMAAGVTAATAYVAAGYLVMAGSAIVLGAVSRALLKPPSASSLSGGQMVTAKQPIGAHTIVYGRTRVGSVVVFMEGTNDNKYLHLVLAVAGHEIDGFEKVYFNDEEVALDAFGIGYDGKARVQYKLGTDDQVAFQDLITESAAGWGNNHRLRGRACAYVRLEYNQDKFPSGVPNITFLVRGKKVYDPRSGSINWSANAALCLNDYLTSTRYGLGATYANEIDAASLIASANICDEIVNLYADGAEMRYLMNGAISTANTPQDIIHAMLSAMAGKAVFTSGKWRILAGAYYTPTLTFDENDLRGGFRVQSLVSRRENFNCVKGVFAAATDNYVLSDFPPVVSATFIAQDNGETVYKNIELPFTTSASMAQRLAKIELLKARQQITLTMPLKLQGLQANVGDIVQINNTRMGWSAKPFEVVAMQMSLGEALGVDLELREISTDVFSWLTSEESAYDPAPNTNLPNAFLVAPVTDLTLSTQTLIAVDGTAQAGILATWTPPTNAFVERYEVQYIRGASNFDWGLIADTSTATTDHGYIVTSPTTEADYGIITEATSSAEPQYNSVFVTTPYYFINGAIAGAEYAVRVRAINVMGVRSAWSTSNQTTYGDTVAPDAPSELTAYGGYRQITLTWLNPSVADFDYVEIFTNIVDNFSGSTKIGVLRGTTYVDSPLAINYTKFYWVRAVDRSGNVSSETASVNATTEFIDSDSFTEEVMNLFSEAGAYGIEPVATLPATGDFDGQIKYDTTNNKLWRWDATGVVWTDDIFSITSGSVDAASFAAGIEPVAIESSLPSPTGYTGPVIVFNTADNKLYRYTGTAWVASIATTDLTGTLPSGLFSSTLRPIEVVAALPSTGNFAGRVAVLTTDGKLYRYDTAWTAAVSTTDLSGTVSSAQIAGLAASKITGTLSDTQLAEISAAKISGQLSNTQIAEIASAKITGQLTSDQVADLDAAKITGLLTNEQLQAIAATKITGTLTNSQLDDIATSKLTGTIESTQITDDAVTTAKINAGAVTTEKITAGAITADTIAASAITTAKINAGAVTTATLAAGAVTANEIGANAITTDKIDAGAITTAKIAALAVTAATIAADAITAVKIEAGAVTTAKIAAGAVTADEIGASAITAVKIDAGAVSTEKLAAGAVTADTIAANAITTAKIDTGAITAAKVAAGAIEADKIAAEAVTAGKIFAGSISATEMAVGSITADALAVGAVTADAIAANSISAEKIVALSIGAAELAADSITAGKIAAAAISTTELFVDGVIESAKIKAGDIQGDRIAANTITGGLIAASGIITSTAQINDALITNAKIENGAITTAKIGDAQITNAKIGDTIQSTIFTSGETGWQILKSGSAEFNGVVISRQLVVDTGDYVFGNYTDNNSGTLDELMTFYIETNTNTTAWVGTNETYMALVSRKGILGYVYALSGNASSQPQNIQWGWSAEVVPITRWSGNARLFIKVTLHTRYVDRLEGFTLTWKLIKVT